MKTMESRLSNSDKYYLVEDRLRVLRKDKQDKFSIGESKQSAMLLGESIVKYNQEHRTSRRYCHYN